MGLDKVTIPGLIKKRSEGLKITMITAYDHPTACIVDSAGIDIVLVGDSLGMVMLGYESTVSVTMRDMLHHSKAVARGVKRAFLVADMPFMSYQHDTAVAVRNAGRFIKEGGCAAVKIEGGKEMAEKARAISEAGIPVFGHIGLLPQSSVKQGGFKVQGRDPLKAKALIEDAVSLEKAGCSAIVLECIPSSLAESITNGVSIPTIGIGAGPDCDGQVLVINDIIGLYSGVSPKFVKQYARVGDMILSAVEKFKDETEKGIFPGQEHSYPG